MTKGHYVISSFPVSDQSRVAESVMNINVPGGNVIGKAALHLFHWIYRLLVMVPETTLVV